MRDSVNIENNKSPEKYYPIDARYKCEMNKATETKDTQRNMKK